VALERAKQWGLQEAELRAFISMVYSAPWKIVDQLFIDLEREAQEELLNRTTIIDIARAQGKAQVMKTIRQRIRLLATGEENAQ